VLRYRIIFRYDVRSETRVIQCVYAAERSLVYEVFAQEFAALLKKK
jgi:hypothetical protein